MIFKGSASSHAKNCLSTRLITVLTVTNEPLMKLEGYMELKTDQELLYISKHIKEHLGIPR